MKAQSWEPWRDRRKYVTGRLVKCLGCRTECHLTHWGPWCYDCNVERIERISKTLSALTTKEPRP